MVVGKYYNNDSIKDHFKYLKPTYLFNQVKMVAINTTDNKMLQKLDETYDSIANISTDN